MPRLGAQFRLDPRAPRPRVYFEGLLAEHVGPTFRAPKRPLPQEHHVLPEEEALPCSSFLLLPSIEGDAREVSVHHFACRCTSVSIFSSRDQAPAREPFFGMALSPETRGQPANLLS